MNNTKEDKYREAREFAERIGARITLPSDPSREWVPSYDTNIVKTFDRAREELLGPF